MAKISTIAEVVPNLDKIAGIGTGLPNAGVFSPAGIKQINLVLTNIREMVKEAKGLQTAPAEKEVAEPENEAKQLTSGGVTKEQLFGFGKQFLDNLIKQGYGDKTLAETISDIPLTVKQLRGLLK